jgi:hypothetical protein
LEQEGSPGKGKKKKKQLDNIILDKSAINKEQKWIKAHSVSYTYNRDEFLPNPDSKLWLQKHCDFDEYRNFPVDLI